MRERRGGIRDADKEEIVGSGIKKRRKKKALVKMCHSTEEVGLSLHVIKSFLFRGSGLATCYNWLVVTVGFSTIFHSDLMLFCLYCSVCCKNDTVFISGRSVG